MAKVRDKRVMVRIGPGTPDEVRFTAEEKTAVERAAKAAKTPLSTFIREVGAGSSRSILERDGTPREVISAAAEECNLRLGEFLRLVVLAAVCFTPLPSYMEAGRVLVKRRMV